MSDTIEILTCPACGAEMKKIFIPSKGINVDICTDNCGGIFFDNKEFQQCSSSQEEIPEIKELLEDKNFMPVDESKTRIIPEIKELLEDKNFMPVDESKTRICPTCKTPMAKTKTFGIQIDTCYNCGGIFLDNQEFEKIRAQIKPKKQRTDFDPNKYKDIDLHEFCKDALEEDRQIKATAQAVDMLARTLRRHRGFFRSFF